MRRGKLAVRFARTVSSQRSSESSQSGTSSLGVDAGHGCADVDGPERLARLVEEAVDVRLDREDRPARPRPAELVCQRPRALLAAMEVDEDARALRRERARAGRADAARARR